MDEPLSRLAPRIVALSCILTATRVLIFSAGFPLFNNVDERAHVDLVLKYSHGKVPHGIENYSAESARYFVYYSSPEYFLDPNKEPYGPPVWTLPAEEREQVLEAASHMWQARPNHESGEPPLYYTTRRTVAQRWSRSSVFAVWLCFTGFVS